VNCEGWKLTLGLCSNGDSVIKIPSTTVVVEQAGMTVETFIGYVLVFWIAFFIAVLAGFVFANIIRR
jgi:hypothetical protein